MIVSKAKNTFSCSAQRTGKKVTLTISGYIHAGHEKNSSQAIAEQLDQLQDGDQLTVVIRNCNGGSVIEGLNIYEDLKALKPTVLIDGVAASMGAIIALAGDTIKMGRHSKMMLHRVTVGAGGNADDVAVVARQAKEFEDQLVAIVAERTGKTKATTRAIYFGGSDVWLNAKSCLKAGLVDEIVKGSVRQHIPTNVVRNQTPAAVVATFEAAMRTKTKPAPAPEAETGLRSAITSLENTLKQLLGMKTATKKPATLKVSATGTRKSIVKTLQAELKKNKVKAVVVNTDELQAALEKSAARLKRIKALKAELAKKATTVKTVKAKAEKKTAKLRKQITAGTAEAKQKKDPKVAGKSKDPMAALNGMTHNKDADRVIGHVKGRKLTDKQRAAL